MSHFTPASVVAAQKTICWVQSLIFEQESTRKKAHCKSSVHPMSTTPPKEKRRQNHDDLTCEAAHIFQNALGLH